MNWSCRMIILTCLFLTNQSIASATESIIFCRGSSRICVSYFSIELNKQAEYWKNRSIHHVDTGKVKLNKSSYQAQVDLINLIASKANSKSACKYPLLISNTGSSKVLTTCFEQMSKNLQSKIDNLFK